MNRVILITLVLLASNSVHAESRQGKGSNDLFGVLDRLEQLQSELQQLRGVVEEQAYKINALESNQNAITRSFEQGFQQPDNTSAIDNDLAVSGDSEQVVSEPEMQKQIEPTVVAPEMVTQADKIYSPTNVKPTMPVARPTYKRSILDEKQAYEQAYEMLKTGGTADAIALFKKFLQDYPRGEYADNSSYWLAEAYKLDQQIGLARLTFQNLIATFSSSPKVPDAKLKLAFIEAEMRHFDQARELLKGIVASYPGTSVASLASKKLIEISSY